MEHLGIEAKLLAVVAAAYGILSEERFESYTWSSSIGEKSRYTIRDCRVLQWQLVLALFPNQWTDT